MGRQALREVRAWLREPPDRDVEGNPVEEDPVLGGSLVYYWPRWRGSAKRICDLSLTMQEEFGGETRKPISVRWSPGFTHRYESRDFVDRIDESRLGRAELISVCVSTASLSAEVRLSGHHGEPGAEMTVEGSGRKAAFDKLKQMVELGDWRPLSSERIAALGGVLGWAILMVNAVITLPKASSSALVGLLDGVARGVVWGVVGVTYVYGTRFVMRRLMPPLEIRSDGVLAVNALSTFARWAIAGVPAIFAVLAGVSEWLG